MDTIDVSNLNRQFLFRPSDVGKPKAVVAAEFVMKRFHGVKITPHFGKLQDKDEEFYRQFTLVISGLDSIEARRWINNMLVQMVNDDVESVKPLIDGGTEGFRGQCKVIMPTFGACYECSIDTISGQTTYPMCTITNNPRLPEHCIEYASEVLWKRERDGEKLDMDNPEHVTWLTEKSLERASEFNIDGITRSLVLGVVKNIIPAIASTNAIVAAACCNEAFKIVTSSAPCLENFMMYSGSDSIFTYCFAYERKPDCTVCGGR
ncbi:NEDD8-activating enzyme E1 catalytic subunit [Cyberlindnera fabianii]|uniref:NEDD8-activating enzyme E1 catalytic subunit n=1 Tax=Cyberlindnera fabianii TaxID=36022 RepID=A0A1V2LBF5_CYBFA|nr:NEDD8-activating enzyme E1 catalytic subunit [Cyberlindnera fabianii]